MQMQASLQQRQTLLLQEKQEEEEQRAQRAEKERMEEQRLQRLKEPPRLSSEELTSERQKIAQMVAQMETLKDFDMKQVSSEQRTRNVSRAGGLILKQCQHTYGQE